jgi:hypothetical protein
MRPKYHEPQVASSTPLKVLRRHLVAARRRGEAFQAAWPTAVKIALEDVSRPNRREWRECLEHTRSTWQRCFDQEPATPAELAMVNARMLIDRQPLPDVWCEQCGGPLGADPIGHKYCGRDCSREASAVASLAGVGTRRGPMQHPQLPIAA